MATTEVPYLKPRDDDAWHAILDWPGWTPKSKNHASLKIVQHVPPAAQPAERYKQELLQEITERLEALDLPRPIPTPDGEPLRVFITYRFARRCGQESANYDDTFGHALRDALRAPLCVVCGHHAVNKVHQARRPEFDHVFVRGTGWIRDDKDTDVRTYADVNIVKSAPVGTTVRIGIALDSRES